jgi:glycosyltransferase involved in cell wall biosynthesis
MRVVLLSTFGPEVRGISYYSDCLLDALRSAAVLEVVPQDYLKVYPDWLYPAQKEVAGQDPIRTIHYARPGTWRVEAARPDVIHLQSWTFVTALIHRKILSSSRRAGIPTVITLHNPVAHERFGFLRGAERRCLELADRIVIHDECGLDAIPPALRGKVRIIPHGTERIEIDDGALHRAPGQPPYLLCFGNIRPYKGVELLVSAWRRIAADFPETRLIVAGRLWEGASPISRLAARLLGTARQASVMKALAKDPSLPRVEFRFDFIPDETLDELIHNARYAVFPYQKFSGHSGAVARAASQGTPVLVSDAGGLPSLAIGPEYVCKAADPDDLAAMLAWRLASPVDDVEERRAQLQKARGVSWDRAAEAHIRLYEELNAP